MNYQLFLAIYGIPIEPVTYTGSENIDYTINQIYETSMKINGEVVMHPRSGGGVLFEMYAGSSSFACLQNQRYGGQPIAIFNSLDQPCDY